MPDIGVLICGHGSRHAHGVREFSVFAGKVERRFPHWTVGHGFLEFAEPSIADGLASLRARGVKQIIAAPALLFSARHAQTDIPAVLTQNAKPGEVVYADALGFDPKMLRAAADRIEEAEAAGFGDVPRDRTLLMVAGRGTSDPDANGDLAKLARILSERMQFGWGTACYAGVTEPQTARALEHAVKLGYRRVVVMPYFLFTGSLVERVHAATDEIAGRHPGIEFLKATHLGDHPLVIETYSERIIAALEGEPMTRAPHPHEHPAQEDCDDVWHNHAPISARNADDETYALAPEHRAEKR